MKKRLKLLYSGSHELEIRKGEEEFEVAQTFIKEFLQGLNGGSMTHILDIWQVIN